MTQSSERARFRDVLALREFRAVWLAEIASSAGEQVARVAVAILVLDRTGSGPLAGLTYALTFLPSIAGPVISGTADRYSRRAVMVAADILRAVLVAAMVIPGMPLIVLFGLLLAAQVAGLPAKAARGALLPDILEGDLLIVGQSLRITTQQVSQMAGFAGGGLLTAITPQVALLAYSGCFLMSAFVLARGVRPRPAVAERGAESYWQSTVRAGRAIWRDPRLRSLAVLAALLGLTVVPEGIAAAYVQEINGGGPAAVGLLMAADPIGMAIGAYLLGGRLFSADRKLAMMGPLAAAGGLPLLVCVLKPGLVVSMVIFMVTGACAAYLIVAGATFSRLVPTDIRGQCMGFFSALIAGSTGLSVAVAAGVLTWVGPSATIALTGVIVVFIGVAATAQWRRATATAA